MFIQGTCFQFNIQSSLQYQSGSIEAVEQQKGSSSCRKLDGKERLFVSLLKFIIYLNYKAFQMHLLMRDEYVYLIFITNSCRYTYNNLSRSYVLKTSLCVYQYLCLNMYYPEDCKDTKYFINEIVNVKNRNTPDCSNVSCL